MKGAQGWAIVAALVLLLILLRRYRHWQSLVCSGRRWGRGSAEGFSATDGARYPDCVTTNDASCTPGGFTVPGATYNLPGGRCVKAKTRCAGCLEAAAADKTWVDPESFESCDAARDTTVLTDTPFGCDDYAARYPDLLGPMVSAGSCGALKRHFLEIGQAEGKVAPVVDMNRPPVLFPYCKPDCVNADGSQRIGNRYWLSRVARCVRAVGECSGCLERENRADQPFLATENRGKFGSCSPDADTTTVGGTVMWTAQTGNARPAAPSVNCNSYLGRYPDLWAAFGPNCTAAREHYEDHGISEGRNPNPDPTYNVWPMCKENGDCVVPGGIRKDVLYRMSGNRCAIPRTNDEGRMQSLVAWSGGSPHYADGSFSSCEANRNTFEDPPVVNYPGCKTAATPCLHPGGYQIDGQRYRMPNGRCLRAKGTCKGCLDTETDMNAESLRPGNQVHFESCEPGRDTTAFNFDCTSYLGRYPDVFRSPFGETCQTAKDHYTIHGVAEGRDASRDPMLNAYPLCLVDGTNGCKDGLKLGATYRFGMNRDKCAVARTTDTNKLSLMNYSPMFSTFRTDGTFDSCESGRDTRV